MDVKGEEKQKILTDLRESYKRKHNLVAVCQDEDMAVMRGGKKQFVMVTERGDKVSVDRIERCMKTEGLHLRTPKDDEDDYNNRPPEMGGVNTTLAPVIPSGIPWRLYMLLNGGGALSPPVATVDNAGRIQYHGTAHRQLLEHFVPSIQTDIFGAKQLPTGKGEK